MEVVVPDDSLSIAIGKNGQNVRLASKLSGWHLDVKSETRYNESMKKGYDSLMNLTGMTNSLADVLFKKGFFSAEDLSRVTVGELVEASGITEAEASQFIELAAKAVADRNDSEETDEEENTGSEIENNNTNEADVE